MPVKEFICGKCGKVFEKLCRLEENTYKCPECGEVCNINYTGKCNCYKGAGGGCSGNCGCCSGCGH